MIGRTLLVACMTSSLLGTGSLADSGPDDVPGTYNLLVCKGPCSFGAPTNVVVKGVLVLTAGAFKPKTLNQHADVPFERAYGIGGDPNGCFVLEVVKDNQTYAGLIEFGMTLWRPHSAQVQFELYTSPDAGHFSIVTMTTDGFQGTGGSSGGGATAAEFPPDNLVAKRVGPGDVTSCVRAAEELQRKPRGAV
jgi:hypothetical protein